jgi:hypothetical protein
VDGQGGGSLGALRFSVEVYFVILAGVCLSSAAAFVFLDTHPIALRVRNSLRYR